MDRRRFLKRAALTTLGVGTVGAVYPFLEAKWCRVVHQTIAMPKLPAPFRGTRVALLADVHHGPFVPLGYIRHVVRMTNALRPDLVLLAGDYMHRSAEYIEPGIAALGKLEAPWAGSRSEATTTTMSSRRSRGPRWPMPTCPT